MRALILAAILVTGGCAPTLVASNGNGGIVRIGALKESRALAEADAFCAQSGRTARVTSSDLFMLAFDCVPPPSS